MTRGLGQRASSVESDSSRLRDFLEQLDGASDVFGTFVDGVVKSGQTVAEIPHSLGVSYAGALVVGCDVYAGAVINVMLPEKATGYNTSKVVVLFLSAAATGDVNVRLKVW